MDDHLSPESVTNLLRLAAEPRREVCYAKIHRCVVTQAELDYAGSVTIDAALLRAAGIYPYSKVEVVNISRAEAARIMTYAIEGPEKSGVVCLNGAAAHHFGPGDLAIVMAYEQVPASRVAGHAHVVVNVHGRQGVIDEATNRIRDIRIYRAPALSELGRPENDRFAEPATTEST